MQTHKVPTHMNMPDKLVLGLDAKQLLIMLIGCSFGYDIWLHLHDLLAYDLPGLIIRLTVSLFPVVLALALALASIAGRPLEVWAFVLLRYMHQPKAYVWRSIRYQEQAYEPEEEQHPEETDTTTSRARERG